MAYKISEKCKLCGKCESICPVEAIAKDEQRYKINHETCVECGVCAGECPAEAIVES